MVRKKVSVLIVSFPPAALGILSKISFRSYSCFSEMSI
jgi:hypothetical protein